MCGLTTRVHLSICATSNTIADSERHGFPIAEVELVSIGLNVWESAREI